jgi:hypothetical protein
MNICQLKEESMLSSLQPPLDKVANSTSETVVLIVVGCLLAALMAWGFWEWTRGKPPVLVVCLIGGGVATLLEPMWDVTGRLYVYERGAHIAFTIDGRGMPWWVVISYAVYLGVGTYVFYRLASGPAATAREFWIAIVSIMGLNLAMEGVMTHVGLYKYFGPQALNPTGFPLHYLVQNIAGPAAAGIVVARFPALIRRTRIVGLVLLVPSFFVAGEIFVGWPSYAALAAKGSGYALVYAAVVPTLLLAALTFAVMASIVAGWAAPHTAGASSLAERLRATPGPATAPAAVGPDRLVAR